MPLQIWLPLTDGIENQGLMDLKFTSQNTTISNVGKLGQCYQFSNPDKSYIGVTGIDVAPTAWSVAAWICPEQSASSNMWIVAINGTQANNFKFALSIYSRYFGIRINASDYRSPTRATLGEWYHVCATYISNTVKLYVDGELVTTDTNTATPGDTHNFNIGRRQGDAGYFTGKVNDVRVYDHVLSAREVYELAKGLVIHYPLNMNWGRANILKTVPSYFSRTSYQVYRAPLLENLVAGTTYTVQLWDIDITHSDKTADELGTRIYWGGGTIPLYTWMGTDYIVNGHADYLTATFTITAAQASKPDAVNPWLNIYNSPPASTASKSMTIGRWKLEKGSTPTPWQPCVDDIGYTLPMVYDTSGNGYNAEMTTNLVMSDSTARNTVSTQFDADQHIVVSNIVKTAVYADSYTFSWWAKFNYESNRMMWGFADGNRFNLYMSGKVFYLNTNNGSTNSFETAVSATQYGDNQWHHFALTGDGIATKLYIDGEFKHDAATYVGLTGTTIVFNGYNQTSSYNFNGSLSDFRMYANPLSAADIKSLYEVGAAITDSEVILVPGEFLEDEDIPKIRKTGVFQAEEILEDSAVSIETDALKAADFVEL